MKKLLILAAALVSTVVVAQTEPAPGRRTPVIENMNKAPVSTAYCLYDDKRFSEGAVKTFDGVRQICMERDSVLAKQDGEPKEMVWESENSFRGKSALGRQAAAVKK